MRKYTGQTSDFLEFQEWCKEKGVKPLLVNMVDWMKEKRIKSVKLPKSKKDK